MWKQAPASSRWQQLKQNLSCLPCALLLSALPLTAQAGETAATDPAVLLASFANHQTPQLIAQRELYQRAQQAYKQRNHGKLQQLAQQLDDYPLAPYLQYKLLIRQLPTLSARQIEQFLTRHSDTVIGERFRQQLIVQASRDAQWQRVLDYYRPHSGVRNECRYLNALIHSGKAQQAYPRIEQLWLSGHSQPNSCDTVFKAWQQAGHKTPALIWQRFKLAMAGNNAGLARYLIKFMPGSDAKMARHWLKLHRQPQLLAQPGQLDLRHPDRSTLLLHSLKRLSYRDIEQTIEHYKHYSDQLSTAQNAQITRRIGLQLARNHMPDADTWLSRVADSHVNQQVREWRIRTAIRQGEWDMVLQTIAQLPGKQQAEHRWQYWWAHASQQLGRHIDAQGIYQYLASKRSYYGFLAADQLALPYTFEDRPLVPDIERMQYILQQPETLRAREFYLMQQEVAARREWHQLIQRLDTEEKLAASKLAQLWRWHDRAIVTMGKTRYRDDIELRFPLHHQDDVNNWSEQHNIDPAWTYAIIRRESAFMQDVRSPVGAVGLMQLMPSTARQLARQMNIRYRGRYSLIGSDTNIRLGTGYLERMLNRLQSQHVLATAAYNAGPSRVTSWLPEHQQMDAVRWIETIPFTETREYVSNVLAYMAIYEHRLQRDITPLSQRMPPVPARNQHTADNGESRDNTAQVLQKPNTDPS
jgi:soluble lytic murein transglycosylase